jgi:HlyD family secretion protein
MRKWLILLAAVGLVVAGWWYVRTYQRFTPNWQQPKYGKVTRGSIEVPITAAGLIEPSQRVEIKSEASGEVIEVRVLEGDSVRSGEVLVVLKPDDEQRSVTRSRAALDRVKALLAQALVAQLNAQANVITLEAALNELRARKRITELERENTEQRDRHGEGTSRMELVNAQAQDQIVDAQIKSAEARLQTGRNSLSDAAEAIKIQQAAVQEAEQTLADAEERLRKTTIVAPVDGIVTDVFIRKGMLVQSATQSFNVGTPLLTIADVSDLKVLARVDEADYGRVVNISPVDSLPELQELRRTASENAGQMEKRSGVVQLTVDAFPDKEFSGRIERVEPQGKLNAGSAIIQFDVHIVITDKDRYILPLGTQAQVEFTVESVKDALLVPAEAVKSYKEQKGVWLKTTDPAGPGQFGKKFVACRFGITDGAHTELAGVLGSEELREGQEVYTKLPSRSSDKEEDEEE